MKATLTVTGGFTGIGGKWEVDATSAEHKAAIAADKWQEFDSLVETARAQRVLGQDYTAMPSAAPAQGVPADMQTYELVIDDQRVKWSEPAAASGQAAVPDVLKSLKNWMTRNAKRQPFRPS